LDLLWAKVHSKEALKMTLEGHSTQVISVAISSDNSKIVSGSSDHTIKVWDLNTGRLLNTLIGHSSRVISVAISSNNSKIVSGSLDRTIKVWDLNTGRLWNVDKGTCYLSYKFDESMRSITFSKNGYFIALGGRGGDLYLGSLSA
jgi:WD40 repeat protein